MCQHDLHDFLVGLPKCEHHVHIEGTLSPALLFQLAAKNKITLPSPEEDPAFASPEALLARYSAFTSLDDFLHYYYIGFTVLHTASDFESLAYDYLSHAHGQRVRHAEVFFDPQAHIDRGVPYTVVIQGLDAARRRAETELPGFTAHLIPCLLRHLPVPSAHAMVADIAAQGHFTDGTLLGFGMSGSEKGFHPTEFSSVYAAAREAGVRNITAHAGEEGPAEYVTSALDDLSVMRIDHGRRAIEDPELMARLVVTGTLLTVCPISNVVLRGAPAIADLPIRRFLDAGIRFSINSDDPAYFGGYVLENYCAVQEAFELSLEEWRGVAVAAVEGSWCCDERKGVLRKEVEGYVESWRGRNTAVVVG